MLPQMNKKKKHPQRTKGHEQNLHTKHKQVGKIFLNGNAVPDTANRSGNGHSHSLLEEVKAKFRKI